MLGGHLHAARAIFLNSIFQNLLNYGKRVGIPVSYKYRVSPYTTDGAALALSTGLAWLACFTFRKRSNEEMWGSGLPTGQCIGIGECLFCIGLE